MSQEGQNQLHEQTQRLMQGPLQHIRSAALAAALLPLASVAAAPAAAQSADCASAGTVCGYVWNDENKNGIQDSGETGIQGAVVSIDGGVASTPTDDSGFYYFMVGDGPHTIAVQIPPGTQPSPPNVVGTDDTLDSDGVPDGVGNSVATVTTTGFDPNTDFGFSLSPVTAPGTGTPGYWKNHPEAWPVAIITVGGVSYTRDEAIAMINQTGNDRRLAMFSSLVPAMLNVLIGNDKSCVASTIEAADAWMLKYGGSKVHPASYAWKVGEPLHRLLDNYNNGTLCAPHRN